MCGGGGVYKTVGGGQVKFYPYERGGGWKRLKPLLHCDAVALASAFGNTPNARVLLKFALPPTRMLKLALPPTPTPNASRWNIGCVGSPGVGARDGHVHFMFFVFISFTLGSQREHRFL